MTFLAALLPTSLVNAMGALAIGGYAERFGLLDMPSETPPGRFFFMAGFLGGFTTFSVFSLEMIMLVREGHGTWAIGYGALSLFVWIVAVWVGSWLARTSAQTPPLPDLP
jgi:CrcB protein